jgi:selenocysteine-specific elongation factor
MQHIVVGTAGHIDHGKTALVKALTGIDTDRLQEEKRRGISIDIGFASVNLNPNLRLAFVDVPGHERFVKNMLAGVAGIDLVLLVIAADDSIMPQTREHFDICRLLGIRHGIVVLTKSDLVDSELLDLVRLEAAEFVSQSFLEGAPILPVSATTGSGLGELRAAIEHSALEITGKDTSRYPRLPIDRSFSMRGHGAVVTGTLISGGLCVHDDLELYPCGKTARVRALEVSGRPVERVQAGERVAVNLGGIESSEVVRGMVLAPPGLFRATRQVDCAFDLLPGARPLKHRAPVHFHAGTAKVEAHVSLLSSLEPARPGTRTYVRFILSDPLLLLPGDRFITRMFSPVLTIGGGVVLDNAPPAKMKRVDLARRLVKLDGATPADRVALLVAESRHGMSIAELVPRTEMLASEIREIADSASLVHLPEPHEWLASRASIDATLARIREILKDFHRRHALQPGFAKEELRSSELTGAPAFLLDALLAHAGDIVAEGDIVRLASHRVALQEEEQMAAERIEGLFREGGLAVPATREVLAKSGIEGTRARALLQILIRERKLVKVGEDLIYHVSALELLRRTLAARKGSRFSVTEFKDWTGISRKYAIPLLELLDREHVTRREGDARIVL